MDDYVATNYEDGSVCVVFSFLLEKSCESPITFIILIRAICMYICHIIGMYINYATPIVKDNNNSCAHIP